MPRPGYVNVYPGNEAAEERALQGWNSYVRGGDEAISFDREQRIREHEMLADRLEQSRIDRELAKDKELAERKIRLNQLAPIAWKEIAHIDHNDPAAMQKILDAGVTHAEVLDGELGDKALSSFYASKLRAIQDAEKRQTDLQAKKDAASAALQARKDYDTQRQQERMDILKSQQDFRGDLVKQAADREAQHQKDRKDDLREAHLDMARGKYEAADAAAQDLRDRLAQNEGFIKEQQAKPKLTDTDKAHLNNMVVSRDQLKAQLSKHEAAMKGLESQFPELSPTYQPKSDARKDAGGPQYDSAIGPPAPAEATPLTGAMPAATPQPDITEEAYNALQPGDTFWYGGRQLTKQGPK